MLIDQYQGGSLYYSRLRGITLMDKESMRLLTSATLFFIFNKALFMRIIDCSYNKFQRKFTDTKNFIDAHYI